MSATNGASHNHGKRRPLRFPRAFRIVRHVEFDRVLQNGLRTADGRLTLWVLPSERGLTRLGLIVGRRHGNAVRRNRIKRVLREAFRLSRPDLPAGLDLICAPRVGADIELEGCQRSFRLLAERLARRLARQQ